MKIYNVTVTDKVASPDGEEPMSYESHIAVGHDDELPMGFTDEDIHYYFNYDEWEQGLHDGTIENDEFTYLVGERVA